MRRLGLAVTAAVVAFTLFGARATPVQAATAESMSDSVVAWMNHDREARGLRPYRRWSALTSIAMERAGHMANSNTLSHDAAGGDIGDEYDAAGIQWWGYGEIIGVSSYPWGTQAANNLYGLWKNSPPHASIMFSSSYNYIGVGFVYRASNNTTWSSIVFAESRDHTDPVAKRNGIDVSGRTVVFHWSGHDRLLQTHTSGLDSFDVQYRVDNGSWRTIRNDTSATSLTLRDRARGHHYGFRVRAKDGRGNLSGVDERGPGLGALGGTPDAPGDRHGRRLPFAAVNLISDPIHRYVELTKRLTAAEARAADLHEEDVAEDDLLDTAWVQRLRRVSQLQSARWVFPTAEHSRFTHGLGVMHEAGLWARSLYPSLRGSLAALAPGEAPPSEGLVVETLRIAGLLHDVGHGPFAHFFDEQFLAAFPAPADPRRPGAKTLSHEDLSQLVIERELEPLIRGLRRAPGSVPERDRFAPGEAIDPRWVSFLVSKPPLVDPAMPPWVRLLQPLLSGVFTVDNLDYVRRDAYLTGVSMGPVDAERLRRYAFVSERGLTLYESGVGALEMFLTARLFMYQHVYLHRTVRAIDLDLGEVFAPSIRAVFGDGSPAERLAAFADLDEYALLHQAALWARGERVSGAPSRGRRDGDPRGGGRLARDPAPAPALARGGRGPARVGRRRLAGGRPRAAGARRGRTRRRGPDGDRRPARGGPRTDARDRAPRRRARSEPGRRPGTAAGLAPHRAAVPAGRLTGRMRLAKGEREASLTPAIKGP